METRDEAFGQLTTEQFADRCKAYFFFLLKYWYVILMAMIAGVGLSYCYYSKIHPTYPGNLIYYIKIQDITKESKIRIQQYSKFFTSQQFAKNLLLSQTSSNDLLANMYIAGYQIANPHGLHEEIPPGYRFKSDDFETYSYKEKYYFVRPHCILD